MASPASASRPPWIGTLLRPRLRVLGRYADEQLERVRVPASHFVWWFSLPGEIAALDELAFVPEERDPIRDYAVGARWNSRFPGLRCHVCRAQIATNSKRPARWALDEGDRPATERGWYCVPCARESDDPRVRELGATAREVPDGFRQLADPWSDAEPKPMRVQCAQRPCPVELAAELHRVRRGDDDAFRAVGTRSAVHLLAMVNGRREKICRGRAVTTRPNIGDLVALSHAGRVDDVRDILEVKFARVMDLVPRLRRHAFAQGVVEALRLEFTAEELAAAVEDRREADALRAAEVAALHEAGAPRV